MESEDDWFDTRYCADGLTSEQLAEIERRSSLAVVRTPVSIELGDPMTALRIVAEDVSLLLAEVRRLRGLISTTVITEADLAMWAAELALSKELP
jgi:TolB-like protein